MKAPSVEFDFAEVMERVQRVIRAIEPHDSVERYTRPRRRVLQGRREDHLAVDGRGRTAGTLTTRAIVIAAGARPFVPPIPGLDEVELLTSDTLWDLRELPRAAGGARRRPDRLRAGAGLRAPRLAR